MRLRMASLAYFGLIASTAVLALNSSARASNFTNTVILTPNNLAGNDTYNSGGVIEGPPGVFDIFSADVFRPNSQQLEIVIHTNYAGVPNNANPSVAALADGTGYGSLFFGPTNRLTFPDSAAPYAHNVYSPGQWTSAFVMGALGQGTLYSTGSNPVAQVYSGGSNPNNVVSRYTTSTGSIVMSNVNGNPITYPYGGNPGWYFRQGQAVLFNPNSGAPIIGDPSTSGWSEVDSMVGTTVTTPGVLTFIITDAFALGDSFAMSWAETCGNGIIQGVVNLSPGGNGGQFPTPIPAALPLFAGGLGLIGCFTRKRKRRTSGSSDAIA
jgi:hypothetical protein